MRRLKLIITALALVTCIGAAGHGALDADVEVSGSGSSVYVDLDIFDVILPTVGALDFIIDPLGLLTLEPGQSAPLDALSGGMIVHTGDARVINNSSYSIKVSVEIHIESTNGGLTGGAVASFIEYTDDDETTVGLVEADGNEENNILIYVIPSAVNLADMETPFVPEDKGYVISDEPITLEFILPGAMYSIAADSDGELAGQLIPGTGSGIGFRIGGYVNTNADWLDFRIEDQTSDITVYTTYTLTRADDEDPDGGELLRFEENAPVMLANEMADALALQHDDTP